LVFTVVVQAIRVQVDDSVSSKSHAKFGASCDDLQNTFHDRVAAFQTALGPNQDLDSLGRAAQARIMMRTYGIFRTLRRARTCDWVIENDSDDIEQARGVVQSLLDGNPCAEAARLELEAGSSAGTVELEIRAIQRAMLVLSSDTCEVVELPEHRVDLDRTSEVDAEMEQSEDELQDAIDNFMEDPEEGESLLQTQFPRFMRSIGVALLMLFLMLACVGTAVMIGAFIGLAFALLTLFVLDLTTGGLQLRAAGQLAQTLLITGGGVGFMSGIAECSNLLYNRLLPRLAQ